MFKKSYTKEELKLDINRLQDDVAVRINSINCGGCGVFASIAHDRLSELGIESEIIFYGYRGYKNEFEDSKVAIQNYLLTGRFKDFDMMHLSIVHFVIHIPKYEMYFDAENIDDMLLSRWSHYEMQGSYDSKEIKVAINRCNWNTMYKTSQNESLKEIIIQNL